MVGFYADALANRLQIDRDGTLGFLINATGSSIVALTLAQMQGLNDDDDTAAAVTMVQSGILAFIFPSNRDLQAYFRRTSAAVSTTALQTSTDTTNGFDGTWSNLIGSHTSPVLATQPNYRNQTAFTVNNTNVKAFRILNANANTQGSTALHLYGKPSAASPQKLELWHPTLDQPLYDTPAYLDFGDFPRNSTQTKSFRLKNRSATLTANTITVSVEALTDSSSPTKVSEINFRYNGGSYGSTASLGSLAPATISQVFDVRMVSSASSVLGLWAQRIIAAAATWT